MESIDAALAAIRKELPPNYPAPQVLVICGSGLGAIGDEIAAPIAIAYSAIPGFHASHVAGHKGQLVFGTVGPTRVMCMLGRFHYYEGHSLETNTLPVRVAAKMGATHLLVTNAAGGLNNAYNMGDLMLIADHVNLPGLAGNHPLRGPNLDTFGPRFLPLSDAYSLDMRVMALRAAEALGIKRPLHEGCYVFVCGPTFETRAECLALEALGGDAVGMSTVPEVVVARHCGMEVLGVSLITNKAQKTRAMRAADVLAGKPIVDQTAGMPTHEEVLATASEAARDVQRLVVEVLAQLAF